MHVETLKTFCDLVETGSLSRAARLNLVSQSAVSQQLRALERRYGRRLIERAPRIGARATDAGRLLYGELKPMLERLAAIEQRLRTRGGAVAGTVRVAAVYSVGLHTLPPTIKRCLAVHPDVKVQLQYRRTNEVYGACLDGEVDFGIVALPTRRAQLEIVPLGYDELVVVAPPSHAIARRARCSLAALDGQPFIGFDRDIPTRRLVDRPVAPAPRAGQLRDGAGQHRDDQAVGRSRDGAVAAAGAHAGGRDSRADAGGAVRRSRAHSTGRSGRCIDGRASGRRPPGRSSPS